MFDFVRPDNPFTTPEHAEQMHALINAGIETLAFISIPVGGEVPNETIIDAAHEWAYRMTSSGAEAACHAYVWELSVWVHRMSADGTVPFPPYDVTDRCSNNECERDHGDEIRAVNTLFVESVNGRYQNAIKAYAHYVHQGDQEEWKDRRVHGACVFAVHASDRICQFRTSRVDEMPTLD